MKTPGPKYPAVSGGEPSGISAAKPSANAAFKQEATESEVYAALYLVPVT